MDKMIRCVSQDGSLLAAAIDSSDIAFTAQKLHGLTKTTAAAFGRLLSAASIMGAMLKNPKASMTVKINGSGPAGTLLAESDYSGNVRGYMEHPDISLPIRADGKLDVGGAVGRDGRITVVRDEGSGEPYIGHVALVSGEIAEDIAAYYAYSEQIPTVCALGVLVDKEDGQVMLSGGVIVQALPFADEHMIDILEQNVTTMDSVTTMLAKGFTPEDICSVVLQGIPYDILDTSEVQYKCNCGRGKAISILKTIGANEIRHLPLVHEGQAEIVCPYCNRRYHFSQAELNAIADTL